VFFKLKESMDKENQSFNGNMVINKVTVIFIQNMLYLNIEHLNDKNLYKEILQHCIIYTL
jgi:hypothetical protein